MESFFKYFENNGAGIFVFIICLFAIVLIIKWVAYIFRFGRYRDNESFVDEKGQEINNYKLRFVIADLLVKIINDFRHLLALVIMTIFGLSLWYVLYKSNGTFEQLKDSLQVVIASFGGIVGTIIGYYFGESSAKAKIGKDNPTTIVNNGEVTQFSSVAPAGNITKVAPPPPPTGDSDD